MQNGLLTGMDSESVKTEYPNDGFGLPSKTRLTFYAVMFMDPVTRYELYRVFNPSENRHEVEIAKSRDMVAVEAFEGDREIHLFSRQRS